MKNAIKYGVVALISVGATLAAVHKAAPSLPTTCAEAYRELQVSGLMCDHSCTREEAERAITVRDLHEQLCQKEADEKRVREEALIRDADKEYDRLHPDFHKETGDYDALSRSLIDRENFEKQWIKEHSK